MDSTAGPLLSIRGLSVALPTRNGLVNVVHGIDLDVPAGKVCGIAGESGSGKSVAMMAILGLLPAGSVVKGQALFRGIDILGSASERSPGIRGRDIALVMQDSHSTLHPMLSIGRQLTDHVHHHLHMRHDEARRRAINLLRQVQIPDPGGAFDAYPHQFSGGMRQRIAIAIALACGPSVLIADEPTTGLDVTVQAGILNLLHELRRDSHLAIVFISHDLGAMSSLADNVTIVYAGRVVEAGPTSTVIPFPRHPYTAALLAALPQATVQGPPLQPIPGHLGPPDSRPTGCAFHPRCGYAEGRCSQVVPQLSYAEVGRLNACLVDPFAPNR
jgi:oligopeptide/dipeptide ABC transporter ATP-binding protein